jgi:lipoprotein-releasing system permease protein
MSNKSSGRSGLIVNIAIAAVAISVAVMLISVAVVQGYKLQITNKITGFSNHIQISRLDFNNSFETNPIYRDAKTEQTIKMDSRVAYVQPYATKAGIIKTSTEFEGIVLKGIDSSFNWQFIESCFTEGEVFVPNDSATSNQIVISMSTAQKLQLKLGQGLVIYFVQEDGSMPRARKFTISGIYSTGFSDLDALYGIIDMRHIQRLNKWEENQITGYEVKLKKYDDLIPTASDLLPLMPMHLQVKTIVDVYPQLFDWLGLLDLNVLVIIVLMVVVACINMSTALLILIVERSNMIGMLKAMGSNNKQVQRIFVFMAASLISKGLLIGNAVGLLICVTQYCLGWIKLNEEAYFLNQVPIFLHAIDVVWINAGAFVLCVLIMLLPAQFVSKITPVKAIKFQ